MLMNIELSLPMTSVEHLYTAPGRKKETSPRCKVQEQDALVHCDPHSGSPLYILNKTVVLLIAETNKKY